MEETEYQFRILAKNKAGLGKPSEPGYLKLNPPGPPGKPSVSNVTDKTAVVTWTPPEYDGGCHITSYIIEKQITSKDRYLHRQAMSSNRMTIRKAAIALQCKSKCQTNSCLPL